MQHVTNACSQQCKKVKERYQREHSNLVVGATRRQAISNDLHKGEAAHGQYNSVATPYDMPEAQDLDMSALPLLA